jgi:protein-S-isoprenylcysteine O-methyltransferase Ste14
MRDFLVELTLWCLQLVTLVWLVAAVYFAIRRGGGVANRVWYFLKTLLPEPWLLVAVPVVFLLIRLVPTAAWQHLRFWNPVLAALGAAAVLASTALMVWARWAIGTMWAGRPMVQDRHELQTTGPYGLVRHPIYTGIAGLALGTALVDGLGATIVVLACLLVFITWRVRSEERMMLATFGDQYQAYRRRVPALVPISPRLRRSAAKPT